jgi:hypothetical protein
VRGQIGSRHALGQLNTTHTWHVDVDQRDVRFGCPDKAQPFFGGPGLSADTYVRLLQDHPETGANQLVIVHEYDVNHLALFLKRYWAYAK